MSENKKDTNRDDWRELLKSKKQQDGRKGGDAPRRGFKFSMWHLLVVGAVVILLNMVFFQKSDKSIPYSQFKALIEDGSIKEVNYTASTLIGYSFLRSELETSGNLLSNLQNTFNSSSESMKIWETRRIANDEALLPLLDEKGVVYLALPERNNMFLDRLLWWILPIFLVVMFWRMARRMGGIGGSNVMSFGSNNAKIVAESDLDTRFKDVAGCDEAKDELEEIVDFLKQPTKYTTIGGKIPKGALLVGSPGTGKTLLARAVAGESGVTFFRMSGADFVEMFVGVGAARVRDLFKQARNKAPCIVFIDELDAIGKSRSGTLSTNDEREQTLNQLLVEMDGFDSTSGVIILAATNRPEVLDPALLRPGRFDRQVVVDKPDQEGREAILRIHSADVKLEDSVELTEIAKATAGLAGADLANIVNEAALLAVRMDRDKVSREDFFEAIEKTAIGLSKKNKLLNPHEREVTAYHETGHALVNVFTPNQHFVKKITIVPRGYGVMGYMLPIPEEEKSFQTREELLGRIDVALGGRAAEEIIYGTISSGAGNDIIQATDIARSMIMRLGMSERFFNVSLDRRNSSYLNQDHPFGQQREFSDETQKYIDDEISRIMSERYQRVTDLLKRHRELLEIITTRLLDSETIEKEELMEIIRSNDSGEEDLAARETADTKPSERARTSGEARNKAIKERLAKQQEERDLAEKERLARKAAEEQSPESNNVESEEKEDDSSP